VNFIYPAFLWALPLVAVPIIIHLLNRRRFQTIDFAAIDFLRRAVKKNRKRLLLEDLILLLLRTLAVLALILGIARPSNSSPQTFNTRPAIGQVFVIDSSLSMAHRSMGSSAFERALRQCQQALKSLDSNLGDRAAIIMAGTSPTRLALGNAQQAALALSEQQHPESGTCQLIEALNIALSSAETLLSEGCQEIEIVAISDLQASTWADQQIASELEMTLAQIRQSGVALKIINVGAENPSNIAVTDLRIDPQQLSPNNLGEVFAKIRGYENEAREIQLSLRLDANTIAEDKLFIPANGEASWSHLISPAFIGSRALSLSINGDDLNQDDQAFAIVEVRATPTALLVGNSSGMGLIKEHDLVANSLSTFLDLGSNAPLLLTRGGIHELNTDFLSQIDLLILADPATLFEDQFFVIEKFVASGGALLIFLGDNCSSSNLDNLFDRLSAENLQIGKLRHSSARVHINQTDWPPLNLFTDQRWQALLTEVPVLKWREIINPNNLHATPLNLISETGEGLNIDAGAAIVSWQHQLGRCVVSNIPPTPGFNRFAEVPGGTLPFLFDLAHYLTTRTKLDKDLLIGDALTLHTQRDSKDLILQPPSGQKLRPQAQAVIDSIGFFRKVLLPKVALAGIWKAEFNTISDAGNDLAASKLFAVNTPAAESNLRPIDSSYLDALLIDGELQKDMQQANSQVIQEHANFSKSLFTLLAAFLIGETLLAAFLDRRRG